MTTKLLQAQEETEAYHTAYYKEHQLFRPGSWLQAPDPAITLIAERLSQHDSPAILDIGCGVGRNAIALAQSLQHCNPQVIALDNLELAIDLLRHNCTKFYVEKAITVHCVEFEAFEIDSSAYDAILAISTLEHCADQSSLLKTLRSIIAGTKEGGINRLTFSTQRQVIDTETGQSIESPVEQHLNSQAMQSLLKSLYSDWEIVEFQMQPYAERLVYKGRAVEWSSTEMNLLAIRSTHS